MQNYKNSLHSLNTPIKRNESHPDQKIMKINRFHIFLFIIIPVSIIGSTCNKDENDSLSENERLTTRFNEEINADSLRSYVTWLQDIGTRFALADNHRDVALRIKQRYSDLGFSDCRLDSFTISRSYKGILYQQWQYNVIAAIRGSENPDSICIIGAHYDDITGDDPFLVAPGANDNAGGVAAALEIARVMKKYNYSPANTIEFIAFGAEELGLYGSFDYAEKARLNDLKIKLMLNNDMIAYQQSPDPASWSVNILDYETSRDLRKKAEWAAGKFSNLSFYNDNTYNRQSDSYPFFVNGYKAIFFFSGDVDPYYHTPDDTADKYNFEYSREIVKICCALLVYNN